MSRFYHRFLCSVGGCDHPSAVHEVDEGDGIEVVEGPDALEESIEILERLSLDDGGPVEGGFPVVVHGPGNDSGVFDEEVVGIFAEDDAEPDIVDYDTYVANVRARTERVSQINSRVLQLHLEADERARKMEAENLDWETVREIREEMMAVYREKELIVKELDGIVKEQAFNCMTTLEKHLGVSSFAVGEETDEEADNELRDRLHHADD